MRSLALVFFVIMLALAMSVAPVAAQQVGQEATRPAGTAPVGLDGVDLSQFVGKYDGRYYFGSAGDYAEMVIVSIGQDGAVQGRVIYHGTGGPTTGRWWDFERGRFDGKRLSFTAAGTILFDLALTANDRKKVRFEGETSGAQTNAAFQFQKKK